MSSVERLKSLVSAGIALRADLDEWITMFPDVADANALRRTALVRPQHLLQQVETALDWSPSVGLFGESQCGKSALVSRFAIGKEVGLGELQIEVPTSIDPSGAVPFRDAFDPKNSDESTGVACRFTASRPVGVEDGHVVAELVSISDLVTSLCAGLKAESGRRDVEDRVARLREVVDPMRGDPAAFEKDDDGTMAQLRHAWDSMQRMPRMFDGAMLADLDNGSDGWDEFVDQCIERGQRPAGAGSGTSPLDRFVSLLWDDIETITQVWRRIRQWIQKLGAATKISIDIDDVRNRPDREIRSLLDIGWISEVLEDAGSRVKVVPLDGRKAGVEVVIPRSSLVAIIRTLVLPVRTQPDPSGTGAMLDVLDFPGARAGKGDRGFSGELSEKDAIEILRRGKLTRLFHASVERLDASVLCLVAKADGNYEARAEVEDAIRLWLDRESWPGDAGSDAPPPMVVAITKSDLLFKDGNAPHQMNQRMKALQGYSERDPSWMTNWTGTGGNFKSVFWVHNPEIAGETWVEELVGDEGRRAKIVEEAAIKDEVVNHTFGKPEETIGRLLQWSPDSTTPIPAGTDVSLLFAEIERLSDLEARLAGLARTALEPIAHMVHDIDAIYIGPGDGDRSKFEETRAREDIKALEESLQRHVLVDLLDLVSISNTMVERAFWEAANLDTEEGGHSVGVVPFERFYDSLKRRFRRRFEKEAEREGRPLFLISPSEARDSLLARFKRFPDLMWFRKGVEDAVGAKVEAYNPSDVRVEAVASIAGMVWNRQMVWLGEVPAVERVGLVDDGPPTLQRSSAASLKILEHWKSRLATTYLGLVDPETRDTDHNLRLMGLRANLKKAIDTFAADMDQEPWLGSEVRDRIEELAACLAPAQLDSLPGGPA